MKNYLFIIVFGILFTCCSTTNEKETRNLESFDKVNLVGSVELRLDRNADHSIEIMANNTADLASLITEVRNGELFIYNEKECDYCKNPKYVIYLNHTGLSDLTLTGKIKLISDDGISQKNLVIRGVGVLNGNIAVSVNNLSVDFNGISDMSISGYADTSNLKINGIGMINAGSLKTNSSKKTSNGIAFINK